MQPGKTLGDEGYQLTIFKAIQRRLGHHPPIHTTGAD